jgi:hypothetical protein
MTRNTGLVGFVALALAGCSNGGILELRITDAPPDTANMASAIVTLSAAEAHFAGGGEDDKIHTDGFGPKKDVDVGDDDHGGKSGWVRVSGPPLSYDLLRLQNGVSELVGDLALPPGKITQIRLFIDPAGTNAVTLKDGTTCPLLLDGVDPTGIKLIQPFKVMNIKEGRTLEVVLDFDLKESVDVTAPCVFHLKPVIKIKSVKE